MNDRTAEFFSEYAPEFDTLYGTSSAWHQRLINRYLRKSMRLRFAHTLAGCDPIEGRTVLDVGCGPGHYAVALAQRGAAKVEGIDFAASMIELARLRATALGLGERCEFHLKDIWDYPTSNRFDYVVVMGFMDYVSEPGRLIQRILSITGRRAFFSFPRREGILAWQRRLRYRFKCPLFMYREEQTSALFANHPDFTTHIQQLSRDYFVMAERRESS